MKDPDKFIPAENITGYEYIEPPSFLANDSFAGYSYINAPEQQPNYPVSLFMQINGTEWELADYHTINATDGAHSSISPSGLVSVWHGNNQTFFFSVDSGYKISQVLVDGAAVGTMSPYTFTNVTAAHRISVTSAVEANDFTVLLAQSGPLWQGDTATIKITTTTSGKPIRAIFNITRDGAVFVQNSTTNWNTDGTEAELFFTDTEPNWQGHTYTVTGVCDTNGNSVGFLANSLDLMWQLKDSGTGDSGTGDTDDTSTPPTNSTTPTNGTQGGGGTGTSPLPVIPTIPGLTPEQSQVVGYSLLGIIVIILVIVAANLNQKKKKKFGRAGLGGGVKGFKRNEGLAMKKLKRKA